MKRGSLTLITDPWDVIHHPLDILSTVNLRTKFEVTTDSSTVPINSFRFQSSMFKSLYVKMR